MEEKEVIGYIELGVKILETRNKKQNVRGGRHISCCIIVRFYIKQTILITTST